MNYRSKLKWPMGLYYPVVIVSAYILALVELGLRRHFDWHGADVSPFPWITYFAVGTFFIVMGILQWFKYKVWLYPVLGIIMGILCFQGSTLYSDEFPLIKYTYFINFFILVIFIIINWRPLYSQERFEINSRRLFRLATEMIRDTGNGYTKRPFSSSKVQLTREELHGLSRFLHGKYIVKPFYENDRIIFTFSMNRSLVNLVDPKEVSHVVIEYDGNISVVISEKDYREYTSNFSFDQLCASMISIFSRFLSYYQNGLENRIISEIKNAR